MKKILKDGPFNRISRDVITNKELSLKAKGLLTLILGLPDNWVFTIVGLQEYVQEGREALLSAMRELIEKGYAVRETRRTQDGRFFPDDYSFYEIPFSFSPQAGNPSAENTVEDMRDTESPEVENPQQLRSIESISTSIKNIKIKKLLAHEPFLNVWKKLSATPKWKKKSAVKIESELAFLTEYELDEATALAQASLDHLWSHFIYGRSTPNIIKEVREKRPKTFVLNPPTPTPPPLSPEETARRNKEALDCSARQIFEDVMKNGRIIGSTDITIAAVFDHLLEEGVIHPEQPRLDEIAAQETDKARRKAKRQVLQETLVQMQADGKCLELR